MFARRFAAPAVLTLCCIAASADSTNHEIDRQKERPFLVEHMRVAAADRLIQKDDELHAYLGARFNTIVLYDNDDRLPKSEQRIAFETAFARAHGLRIMLGKPTEASTVSGETEMALRAHRALASPPATAVSDDEIRERLRLWSRYGDDLIIGVFFLHDDAFYLHTPVERQRHLYAIAHEVVPQWPVFGIIGEFGFAATSDDVDHYFDPEAFDHLIMLMYPLNLGNVTGMPLDTIDSTDPDAGMRVYVHRYIDAMGQKFVRRLKSGQSVVLVVQAFAYDGDSAGHVPRSSDVSIAASLGTGLLRQIPGQESNRSIAYFLWDGARAGMSGLWQRAEWRDAAQEVNTAIDDAIGARNGGDPEKSSAIAH